MIEAYLDLFFATAVRTLHYTRALRINGVEPLLSVLLRYFVCCVSLLDISLMCLVLAALLLMHGSGNKIVFNVLPLN